MAHQFQKFAKGGIDVVDRLDTCDGGKPTGFGRFGYLGNQRQGLGAVTIVVALDQQRSQCTDNHRVLRFKLDRLAEGGLVTCLDKEIDGAWLLAHHQPQDERTDGIFSLCSDKVADHLTVTNAVDGRNRLHLETLGDSRVGIDIHLGQLDLASGFGNHLLDDRGQGAAWATPLSPEVDHHGHLTGPVQNLGLKCGVGDIHVLRVGSPPTCSTTFATMSNEPGIDHASVSRWLSPLIGGIAGTLTFSKITGGHSNLTYSVSDASDRRWVLRRPPLGHVLATAHDMAREHRVISALAGSGVPVPDVIGMCADVEVNDAPFYVMEFVDGAVIKTLDDALIHPVELRRQMGRSLIEVLVSIHDVDVDAVGLSDLGRREGYIERQLKRWRAQFIESADRDVPHVLEVHDTLAARVPGQQGVGIVHGDYRIDNTIMGQDGRVAAVLDWELCTLGDVLADVAAMIAYSDERASSGMGLPMSAEGFPKPGEIRDLYESISPRSLADLDFYLAFAYWRTACIIEGVYTRYAAGAMGADADPQAIEAFGQRTIVLADLAREAAARLPAA